LKLDILAVAAHPDDVEIACSGTLVLHADKGLAVGVLDLTKGEMGTRGSAKLRMVESQAAAQIMGLAVRENIGLPDCFFQNDRESQEKIIQQLRRFKPEVVLCNAPQDRHPDHGKAAQLILDSCFYSGLKKIETYWEGQRQEVWRPKQVFHFIQDKYLAPDFVVDVSPFWERKVEALKAYESQFYNPQSAEPQTPISSERFWVFMEARAREMGHAIGATYGEGFIKSKMIGIRSLFDVY
jgi:bacillithiol biosynthesis deacetylase BshB1